MKTHKDKPT